MEEIKPNPLLRVTQEEMHKVRQFYDIDDTGKIKKCLKMVREWCEKQEHLRGAYEHIDDELLERLYLLSRGSVEGTKTKIDKLCTARGLLPEICLNRHVEEFTKLNQCIRFVTVPYLNPADQARIIVINFNATYMDNFDMLLTARYMVMNGDYKLHFDYSLSNKYIVDFSGIQSRYLAKLNPIILKKTQTLWTEGYGAKISGVHIVNASSIVDKVTFILRQSFKKKVAKRLYVHQSYEELEKYISKNVLPKEYGGDLPSIFTIAEQWDSLFAKEESRKIIRECDKLVSDETQRSTSKFNEECLGMPGSFRQLIVD